MFWIVAKPKVGQLLRRKSLPLEKSILILLKRVSNSAPSYKRCLKFSRFGAPNYLANSRRAWEKWKKKNQHFVSFSLLTFILLGVLDKRARFRAHLLHHRRDINWWLAPKWERYFNRRILSFFLGYLFFPLSSSLTTSEIHISKPKLVVSRLLYILCVHIFRSWSGNWFRSNRKKIWFHQRGPQQQRGYS